MSHLVLTTLDSVLAWAGVLDELDYSARLRQWGARWGQAVLSPTLATLLGEGAGGQQDKGAGEAQEKGAGEAQEKGAKEAMVQGAGEDSFCLPPVVGLVVAQFHNIEEVKSEYLDRSSHTVNSEYLGRSSHTPVCSGEE